MDKTNDPISPKTPERSEFRLPWALRLVGAAAVLVPVGMLVHVNDLEKEELQGSVEGLEVVNEALAAEREVLAERAEKVEGLESEIEQMGEQRSNLALQVAGFLEQVEEMDAELESSKMALGEERVANSNLQKKLGDLNGQVATLRKREGSLHDIIDLLEGEVASAERRLQKLTEGSPQPNFRISGLGQNGQGISDDPAVRYENERLRNELRKHDDQVTELLGEIGILNQELEIARTERARTGRVEAATVGKLAGVEESVVGGQ